MTDEPLEERPSPAQAAAVAAGTGVAIALGSTDHAWDHWRHIYEHHMPRNDRRERLFLAATSFAMTFALTRALTLAIRANVGPFHNVSVGGRHIHHLVWGILLLLVVGYLNIVEFGGTSWKTSVGIRLTCVLFGVGAALTLDEFALWLNLEDVYWAREGRKSIDAVLVFGSLLIAGVAAEPALRALAWEGRAILRGVSRAERIAHHEYERLRHAELAESQATDQAVDRTP
ncbi:MAG: hypothetical protein NVSMB17_10990 [Candidatus Dormibacteria bacterium]